ncbi:MAG: arsenite methyltransferase [Gammaproteobacteria bacterium]|jgi:arsenite methyltransferase
MALNSGESVLDAGCGTGLLLEMEAKAVGRNGRAEGVDFSNDMLDFARRRCAAYDQVKLQQGSIESLDFDDDSFDALSCTQTLLYVDRLDDALNELHRVLKPHGRIVIVETDWRGAILNSAYPEISRTVFDAWDSVVANPNLPRRMRKLLIDRGFSVVRVEAIPIVNAGYSEHSFSAGMLTNFARTAHKRGAISDAEKQAWLDNLQALADDDAYFFSVNRYLFSAIK